MNLFHSTLGLNIPVNGLLPGSTKKETKGGKKSSSLRWNIFHSLWWILRATYKCSSIIHGHVQKHSRCYRMLPPAGLTTEPSAPTTCRVEQTGAELSKKALRCCWAAVSGYQWNLSASGVKVEQCSVKHLSSERQTVFDWCHLKGKQKMIVVCTFYTTATGCKAVFPPDCFIPSRRASLMCFFFFISTVCLPHVFWSIIHESRGCAVQFAAVASLKMNGNHKLLFHRP